MLQSYAYVPYLKDTLNKMPKRVSTTNAENGSILCPATSGTDFTPVEAAPQGDSSGSGAATVDVVEELPSTDKSPEVLPAHDDAEEIRHSEMFDDDDAQSKRTKALISQDELMRQANTVEHMIDHRNFNPYCKHCCRAKAQRRRRSRGSLNMGPKPTKFGEQQTGDHLISRRVDKHGIVQYEKDEFDEIF